MTGDSQSLTGLSAIQALDYTVIRVRDMEAMRVNAPALALLVELPRLEGNLHVIVGTLEGAALVGIGKIWERVRKRAGLEGVRLHDLRHNFASVGAGNGLSLPMIGALLGHKHIATTQRYAHLAADPVRAAGEAVGVRIGVKAIYQRQEYRERRRAVLLAWREFVVATSCP